jgi:hypothetical protein
MPDEPIPVTPILNYASAPAAWQTVAQYRDSFEANLAKLLLESEGIACFIDGENTFSAIGGYPLDASGMRLKVAAMDFARASELLSEIAKERARRAEASQIKCPACASSNVYRESLRLYMMLIFAAAGVTGILLESAVWAGLPFIIVALYLLITLDRARLHCRECGNAFLES